MSESNAAAVAERESPTQTQETTSTAQAEPVENASNQQASVAAETQAGQSSTGQASVAADTAEAVSSFDAAFEKVRGKPARAAEPAELPGKSLDEEFFDVQARQQARYAEVLQNAETETQRILREELGLSPADATRAWQAIRTLPADLHSNNEAHNLQRLQSILETSLTPEEKAEFAKRTYLQRDEQGRIKPYASTAEGLKLALSLREQARDKAWEAKVEAGEYLTRKEAQDIAEAMVAVARSEWEQGGNSASSGQRMASGRGDNRSDAEKLADPNTPVAELKAIRNRQEGYELWR